MNWETRVKKITEQVGKSELGIALSELNELVGEFSPKFKDDLVLIQGRIESLAVMDRRGLMTSQDLLVEQNKIANSILGILSLLEEERFANRLRMDTESVHTKLRALSTLQPEIEEGAQKKLDRAPRDQTFKSEAQLLTDLMKSLELGKKVSGFVQKQEERDTIDMLTDEIEDLLSQESTSRGRISQKIVLAGAFGVGKTSLVSKFVYSRFSEDYLTTIGVKIDTKLVRINDQEVTLIIWDTEGATDGEIKLPKSYFAGAKGLLLVGDGTRQGSIDYLVKFINFFRHNFHELPPCILLLNKSDLKENWCVEMGALNSFTKDGIPFLLTSAKTGSNVEKAFLGLTRNILNKPKEKKFDSIKEKIDQLIAFGIIERHIE